MVDKNLAAIKIHRRQGQLGDLLDPQTAAQHQRKNGPVSGIVNLGEETANLVIVQKAGQRLGHPQGVAGLHRILHRYVFIVDQVVIKAPDAVQIAVDGFRRQTFAE